MELLNKAKALISTYSYDDAINILSRYLEENIFRDFDKINDQEIKNIKSSFELILQIIDQKNDEKLKDLYTLRKIVFFSKSSNLDDAYENIKEIEFYLKRTQNQFCFILNHLTDAYFKVGELERATIIAEKFLDELLRLKHILLYEKKSELFRRQGIRIKNKQTDSYNHGIRIKKLINICIEAKKSDSSKLKNKKIVNTFYELVLFFDDVVIFEEIADFAIGRQEKRLLLALEHYVRDEKIQNSKIEKNLNRYNNFSDTQNLKNKNAFDFAEDLFQKNVKKNKVQKKENTKEVFQFDAIERGLFLTKSTGESHSDLIDLEDSEDNFLDLAAFYIEVGLNRKSVTLLEKYLLQSLGGDKIRKLYYIYIKALILCGEISFAKKILDDFSLNSSFLPEEKGSIMQLFNGVNAKE